MKKPRWNELPDDLKFIAAHPPGSQMTVDERLKLDRALMGMSIYMIGGNGEKIRLDPSMTVIEYDQIYSAAGKPLPSHPHIVKDGLGKYWWVIPFCIATMVLSFFLWRWFFHLNCPCK